MPKNNPAAKNKMVTPKVKGSWWNRDMSMLTTLVPLKYLPVDWIDVPGRTQVDVSPKIDIESLPAVSPLYDGWTLETYYYFVPYRLYMPTLRINNVEDVGDIDSVKFPTLSYYTAAFQPTAADGWTGAAILPGSLLHRLGFLPSEMLSFSTFNAANFPNYSGSSAGEVTLNAIPLLAYLDTWLYSQFNKQDKLIPVESQSVTMAFTGSSSAVSNGTKGTNYKASLVKYDDLKLVIPAVGYGKSISWSNGTDVNESTITQVFSPTTGRLQFTNMNDTICKNLVPGYPIFDIFAWTNTAGANYASILKAANKFGFYNSLSNTGLLPVTYYGDRFTSWFNADSVNKLSEYAVSSGESFLSMRRENANMFLDMIAMVSGNDYRSYLKFVYNTELDLCDHPILVGKDSLSFGFMDVLNQAANVSTDGDVSTDKVSQSLAYTAGKARSKSNNVRDINFKTREPGLFMVLCSLRPTIRYFQGVDAFLNKREYSELWHPQYSSLGFQQIRRNELYAQMVGLKTIGNDVNLPGDEYRDMDAIDVYVPLGWEYQTNVRKLNGAMVLPRYRTWSLARDFEAYALYPGQEALSDTLLRSTYGNRGNFDFNFVDTSEEAQNFIMNFSAKVRCFQPMSKVLVKPSI